jgi:RNA polymerase sigma-70 factor (ECF subfamily)
MMRRKQQRTREVPDDGWNDALATTSTNNPELELLKHQYAVEFVRALREAIEELEPRLRAALRMSFVDAASIDAIAGAYAVHRATAARWLERARDEVFARTQQLLTRRLAVSATEIDRLTEMIRSQLDVRISQLLSDPPGA